MTPRDFCYWLQGLYELQDPKTLDKKQIDLIKRHLNLVFFHSIDPSDSDDPNVQAELQAIHDGGKTNTTMDNAEPLPTNLHDLCDRVEKLENRPQPRKPRNPNRRYRC